jgi:Peptidase inhibitor family I36
MIKRYQRFLVTSAAVLGTFLGAGAMTAPAMASTPPAATAQPATSTNIDSVYHNGDNGTFACGPKGYAWDYCLWYGPNYTGAEWGSKVSSYKTITATFPDNGTGEGQPVRDNAASMGNSTTGCNVTTWYSPGFTGPFNWLDAGWTGNLTASLRDNEASISYNHCS